MPALGADEYLDGVLAPWLPGLLTHGRVLAGGAGDGDGLVPGGVVALGAGHAAAEDLAEARITGGRPPELFAGKKTTIKTIYLGSTSSRSTREGA
jgi:hypothetical protein